MKTLKDHVIIYDDECPMCDLYTRTFVRSGMLARDGRQPWSNLPPGIATQIDACRSRDEIALVNTHNGSVTYGIDSLFAVACNSFPLLTPLLRWSPFRWLMKRIYSFFSYNRKVIMPADSFEGISSCTPSLNLKYRWAYLVFTWIVTSFILKAYAASLTTIIPAGSLYRELAICGGQILFQSAVIALIRRDRLIHYLGNMMTVSLGGAILLLPGLYVAQTIGSTFPFLAPAWFSLVVCLMLFEHARRVRILGIHWSSSLSWIGYRLIVLWLIMSV